MIGRRKDECPAIMLEIEHLGKAVVNVRLYNRIGIYHSLVRCPESRICSDAALSKLRGVAIAFRALALNARSLGMFPCTFESSPFVLGSFVRFDTVWG